MTVTSFGLACLGFILLSVSLKRHFLQVWPKSTDYQRWLPLNRWAGYGLVLLSMVPCVLFRGLWIGLVLWISILALAAFLQGMLLTYMPRRCPVFGGASLLMIMLGGAL